MYVSESLSDSVSIFARAKYNWYNWFNCLKGVFFGYLLFRWRNAHFSRSFSLSLSLEQTNSETKLNSVLTPVTNKLRYKMEMIFRGNSPAQFKWELIGTFLLHSPFRVYFIDALETFVPLGRPDQYASVWMENVIWKMRQKLRLTFKLIISIDI